MATVRYTVINGQIVAEKRDGVRKFYTSDALGSTVALYSGSSTTDTFAYWPYGETRTRTGSTPTKYKFVGTLGCREQADGVISMRARVHQPKDGRWMTVDRLWPRELAFGFVWGNPTTFVDPSGLNAITTSGVRIMPPDPGGRPPGAIRCTKEWNAFIYAFCNRCRFHPLPFLCYHECDEMAREYYRQCEKPGPGSGRFGPPPDGGVGEIAPRPRPGPEIAPGPKPEGPCIRPWPCISGGTCVSQATNVDNLTFNYWTCVDCCKLNPGPFCDETRSSCLDDCWMAKGMYIFGLIQFHGDFLVK